MESGLQFLGYLQFLPLPLLPVYPRSYMSLTYSVHRHRNILIICTIQCRSGAISTGCTNQPTRDSCSLRTIDRAITMHGTLHYYSYATRCRLYQLKSFPPAFLRL